MVAAQIQKNVDFDKIISKVKETVTKALKDAAEEIKKGEEKINEASDKLQVKKKRVCDNIEEKCKEKGSCKTSQEKCKQYGKKMECARNAQKCTAGTKSVCTKTSSICNSWLFSWACKAVCAMSKLVCQGYSLVCVATRKVVDFAHCVVKEAICKAWKWTVNTVCQAACETAKAGLTIAQGGLKVAEGALVVTRKVLGGLAKAAEVLATVVSNLFNINSAGFKIALNSKTDANGITVNLDAVIFGKEYKIDMTIDWTSIWNTAKKLGQWVLDRIKSIFKRYELMYY